jgi:hypothetical protein
MIVSTYQPFFCPFPNFFYKAHLSDVMVLLDDVQFPLKTTWVSRNRFKNDQGAFWITVPVWKKGLGLQRIKDVRICNEGNWRKKGLASLKAAYAKAPYLKDHQDVLEQMFSQTFERLIDLNLMTISYLRTSLRIDCPFMLQSEMGIRSTGDVLLLDICRKLGGAVYLAQESAKKYLDGAAFASADVELCFFSPPSPVYPQLWGDFIHNLSAFDLLLNCGPKGRDVLLQ